MLPNLLCLVCYADTPLANVRSLVIWGCNVQFLSGNCCTWQWDNFGADSTETACTEVKGCYSSFASCTLQWATMEWCACGTTHTDCYQKWHSCPGSQCQYKTISRVWQAAHLWCVSRTPLHITAPWHSTVPPPQWRNSTSCWRSSHPVFNQSPGVWVLHLWSW